MQRVKVGAGRREVHLHVTWDIVNHSFNSGWEKTQPTLISKLSNHGCLHMFSWEGLFQIPLTHKRPIFWREGVVHKLRHLYLAPFSECPEDQRQVSSHFTVPGQIQLKFRQRFKCFSCYKMAQRSGWSLIRKAGNSFQNQYSHCLRSIEAGPATG